MSAARATAPKPLAQRCKAWRRFMEFTIGKDVESHFSKGEPACHPSARASTTGSRAWGFASPQSRKGAEQARASRPDNGPKRDLCLTRQLFQDHNSTAKAAQIITWTIQLLQLRSGESTRQ